MGARVLSITQPVVRPMYESRDAADVLLALAERMGGRFREAFPDSSFLDYLKRGLNQESVLKHGSFAGEDADGFWDRLLAEGVWVDHASARIPAQPNLAAVLAQAPKLDTGPDQRGYEWYLHPFMRAGMGSGREANLPWLQELPDAMTSIVWGSWVEIHPGTAAKLGIADSEWVWIESRFGRIRVPALIQPAARPDTVSMPFGQGHGGYGRYASGRGANPWHILSPAQVLGAGEPAWAATRVRIYGTGEKAPLIRLGFDREHTAAESHR